MYHSLLFSINGEGVIMKLLERINKYIVEQEMKRKFPDPLIVCPVHRDCAHVDGYLCEPKTCSTKKAYEDKNEMSQE